MDINYLIDNNNEIYSIYISDDDKNISNLVDKQTVYYLFNYLYEKIFINYFLIIFFVTCGSSILICNYEKNKKGYVMINNEDTIPVKGQIIEKV